MKLLQKIKHKQQLNLLIRNNFLRNCTKLIVPEGPQTNVHNPICSVLCNLQVGKFLCFSNSNTVQLVQRATVQVGERVCSTVQVVHCARHTVQLATCSACVLHSASCSACAAHCASCSACAAQCKLGRSLEAFVAWPTLGFFLNCLDWQTRK